MNAAYFNSGFCGDKERSRCIKYWLSRNGFPAIAICGDKVQKERERALKSFKNGTSPILVATDIASCGLDIPHVVHVINFDLPKDIDNRSQDRKNWTCRQIWSCNCFLLRQETSTRKGTY